VTENAGFCDGACSLAIETAESSLASLTGILQIVAFPGAEHKRADSRLVPGFVLVVFTRGKA
jgi:hypothetical protein